MPRRRRKFTKEDAIYGLWAEHDSDDEIGRYVLYFHASCHLYRLHPLQKRQGFQSPSGVCVGRGAGGRERGRGRRWL